MRCAPHRDARSGSVPLRPLAIAYPAFDPDVAPPAGAPPPVGTADVAPAATELAPGLWVVGSAFVGLDGEVELTLAEDADVPEEVLVPAGEAFVGGYGGALPVGCSVVASDAAARATAFGLGGIVTVPAAYAFTPSGMTPMLFLTTAVDPSDPGLSAATVVVYAYADRAVTLTGTGTCSDASQEFSADVALEAGWNRVTIGLTGLDGPVAGVQVEDDDGTALRVREVF